MLIYWLPFQDSFLLCTLPKAVLKAHFLSQLINRKYRDQIFNKHKTNEIVESELT